MEEEWFSTHDRLPDVGRRVQRKDFPLGEYVITVVSGALVWHYKGREWPHGHYCKPTDGHSWRYTTDTNLYLTRDEWLEAIDDMPLDTCLDFWDCNERQGDKRPVNKSGDIPFPHAWIEVHVQLATSNAEEIDKSQAIILENTDALINQLQTTGEINVCIRGCDCDPCNNTASANLENRKELIREKARDLIEFDPEILNGLLRDTVGSNATAQLTPWLKQLGAS